MTTKLTYRDDGSLIVFRITGRAKVYPTHRKALNALHKLTNCHGCIEPVKVFPGKLARDHALQLMRERVHCTPGSYYDGMLRRQIEALLA